MFFFLSPFNPIEKPTQNIANESHIQTNCSDQSKRDSGRVVNSATKPHWIQKRKIKISIQRIEAATKVFNNWFLAVGAYFFPAFYRCAIFSLWFLGIFGAQSIEEKNGTVFCNHIILIDCWLLSLLSLFLFFFELIKWIPARFVYCCDLYETATKSQFNATAKEVS